jgi:hypothetical protein
MKKLINKIKELKKNKWVQVSRRKHIIPFIMLLGLICYGIGKLTGIPFDLNWLYSTFPLFGFLMSETEKRKQIKIKKIFVEQKFLEPRFIISVLTPLLAIINWLFQVIFGTSLQYTTLELSTISSGIALYVASFRGGDKSKIKRGKI